MAMNRKRLTELAEWLEAGAPTKNGMDLKFDMRTGFSYDPKHLDPTNPASCGTACCIAGAAVAFYAPVCKLVLQNFYDAGYEDAETLALSAPREEDLSWWRVVQPTGQKLLGLTDRRAEQLFMPWEHFNYDASDFSDPQWAARTIRYLLATGKVDWDATASAELIESSDGGF